MAILGQHPVTQAIWPDQAVIGSMLGTEQGEKGQAGTTKDKIELLKANTLK